MDIDVFLTSHHVTDADVKGRAVVVIDVLRASSTIATALHHGARTVVPVADNAEAGKIAANLDPESYLLGGERGGVKIEGYHLGNSPLEYEQEVVEDRTIIFTTTNGTRAISRAHAADYLVIGSFLNAERVVDFLKASDLPITIICAGWRNRISLEDTLCAGLLLHRLWNGVKPSAVSDQAHIAYSLFAQDRDRLQEALHACFHAKRLIGMGHADDVAYCTQVDHLPILPYYRERQVVLMDPVDTLSGV